MSSMTETATEFVESEVVAAPPAVTTTTTTLTWDDEDEEEEVVYDEVDLDEMEYAEADDTWYYPCPCGDRFFITLAQLEAGETIARCPSCSLVIRVLYAEVADDADVDVADDEAEQE